MLAMPADPTEERSVPQIVPLRIWKDHEPTDDVGNYREVEWVEYAKKGSNGATVIDKIARVRKGNSAVWEVIRPMYEAWQRGQEEPTSGTPLAAWPGVTRGQVDHLKMLNLRSVEDLAGVNDAAMERIGTGARVLRDKALAFVKAKEGRAVLAEELSKKDAEIDALRSQVEGLTKAVESLKSALPKRGRPPKQRPGDMAARQ